jgi:transcription initiation factor TFIIIB Brf1 subunit/transcription initiation factor TFIIB
MDFDSFDNFDDLENEFVDISKESVGNVDDKLCPSCGSHLFEEDYKQGIVYCSNCGQVIDSICNKDYEKCYQDDDSGPNIKSGSIIHNSHLPQASLGGSMRVPGKLRKARTWNQMPYHERALYRLMKKISKICVENNISTKICNEAKNICKNICNTKHTNGDNEGKNIITRGENRKGIVASCLFISCKKNNETRTIKEIARYFDITEDAVNKGHKSLKMILKDNALITNTQSSKVSHFVDRKCDEMSVMEVHKKIAKKIAINLEKLRLAQNHSTSSVCSAIILLMARICNISGITKKTISKSFDGISDVTIQKTYIQIEKYKDILMNDILVDEILDDFERRKNEKQIINEATFHMKKFDIDTSNYIVKSQEEINDINYPKKLNFYGREYHKLRNKVNDAITSNLKLTEKIIKKKKISSDEINDNINRTKESLEVLNLVREKRIKYINSKL